MPTAIRSWRGGEEARRLGGEDKRREEKRRDETRRDERRGEEKAWRAVKI